MQEGELHASNGDAEDFPHNADDEHDEEGEGDLPYPVQQTGRRCDHLIGDGEDEGGGQEDSAKLAAALLAIPSGPDQEWTQFCVPLRMGGNQILQCMGRPPHENSTGWDGPAPPGVTDRAEQEYAVFRIHGWECSPAQ